MLSHLSFTQVAISFALLIQGVLAFPSSIDSRSTNPGYKVAAYYANWDIYGRNFQPQQIPASKLTHLLYAFANVHRNGTVFLPDEWAGLTKPYSNDSSDEPGNNVYGCVKQIYLLKKQNRHMKTLLSIGGYTYKANFSAAVSTAQTRTTFVNTAVEFVKDLGLDGLDVDWEYPANATDAKNQLLLLQAMRSALDKYGKTYSPPNHFLLTLASPAGPDNYKIMQLKAMDPLLDSWHLMAYDYAGNWSTLTGHNSNLYPSKENPSSTPFSADKAVTDYIAAGVNASKIVIGIPIYGRSFELTAGMGKPYSGIGPGMWDQAGVLDYKTLNATRHNITYDVSLEAAYSYNASSKELISFDTVEIVEAKVKYVESRKLGGAMFWECSGDALGSNSLITTANKGLGTGGLESSLNCLKYPGSRYENMANGMMD